MTYADYLKIDDDNRYEILNGELKMVPAPNTDHQSVIRNLEFLIWNFVKGKGLGKVFFALTDVVFDDDQVFQPDIVFVKTEKQKIICKDAIHGIPDIIIEIISPSSTFYDTVEKRDVYQQYGVDEYWLVFPDERAIEVFILENGEYVVHSRIRKDGIIESKALVGLKIDIKEVFDI